MALHRPVHQLYTHGSAARITLISAPNAAGSACGNLDRTTSGSPWNSLLPPSPSLPCAASPPGLTLAHICSPGTLWCQHVKIAIEEHTPHPIRSIALSVHSILSPRAHSARLPSRQACTLPERSRYPAGGIGTSRSTKDGKFCSRQESRPTVQLRSPDVATADLLFLWLAMPPRLALTAQPQKVACLRG